MLARYGLPLDERGRVKVDEQLRVEGHEHVWALGDCAAVPNLATPGAGRPADLAARAPPGTPAGQEPRGRAEALPLPDARPGGHARPLQGHRRRARPPLHRLPRLVHHADVPPLPAAALLAEAARGGRLDDLALLPPRHRRALDARPSPAASMRDELARSYDVHGPRRHGRHPRRRVAVRPRGLHRRAAAAPGRQLPLGRPGGRAGGARRRGRAARAAADLRPRPGARRRARALVQGAGLADRPPRRDGAAARARARGRPLARPRGLRARPARGTQARARQRAVGDAAGARADLRARRR